VSVRTVAAALDPFFYRRCFSHLVQAPAPSSRRTAGTARSHRSQGVIAQGMRNLAFRQPSWTPTPAWPR